MTATISTLNDGTRVRLTLTREVTIHDIRDLAKSGPFARQFAEAAELAYDGDDEIESVEEALIQVGGHIAGCARFLGIVGAKLEVVGLGEIGLGADGPWNR